ncbi:hypothetical protein E0H73_12190 [Kribbella pittospori]|uniref:Uncharacterized protein n=1 Tax=Kribbella pittospori TaxID=722689 RepID=A0A4R0KXU6_9ACTN|nr:hypothetical protein [Kribbella pittospori]TCC63218.1 hypothetical protein E0H73_12190 [Kribbella pittospori]
MRTEEDLRNALDRIAATAPDRSPIVDNLPVDRPPRRRRTALVLATVMATAAAAVGGPILVDHLRDTATEPAGEQAGSPWSNWVTLTAPKGMIVNPRGYEADRQVYQLAGVGSPWARWCLLTLYRNGAFDPGKIPADSPRIDLYGLAGRLVTMPNGGPIVAFPPGYAVSSSTTRPVTTVAWQPAKGIWGLLSCERQQELGTRQVPRIDAPSDTDADTAVAVAKTIKATPGQLSAPFKIGYVPAGLRVQRVQDKTANFEGDGHSFGVVFTDGDQATGQKPLPTWSGDADHPKPGGLVAGSLWGPAPLEGEDLQISYSTDKFWNMRTKRLADDPADLKIHGWNAWFTWDDLINAQKDGKPFYKPGQDNGLRMERNGVAITIRFLGGKADKAQLRKIAESLTLPKDPRDTSQWFNATKAIPR